MQYPTHQELIFVVENIDNLYDFEEFESNDELFLYYSISTLATVNILTYSDSKVEFLKSKNEFVRSLIFLCKNTRDTRGDSISNLSYLLDDIGEDDIEPEFNGEEESLLAIDQMEIKDLFKYVVKDESIVVKYCSLKFLITYRCEDRDLLDNQIQILIDCLNSPFINENQERIDTVCKFFKLRFIPLILDTCQLEESLHHKIPKLFEIFQITLTKKYFQPINEQMIDLLCFSRIINHPIIEQNNYIEIYINEILLKICQLSSLYTCNYTKLVDKFGDLVHQKAKELNPFNYLPDNNFSFWLSSLLSANQDSLTKMQIISNQFNHLLNQPQLLIALPLDSLPFNFFERLQTTDHVIYDKLIESFGGLEKFINSLFEWNYFTSLNSLILSCDPSKLKPNIKILFDRLSRSFNQEIRFELFNSLVYLCKIDESLKQPLLSKTTQSNLEFKNSYIAISQLSSLLQGFSLLCKIEPRYNKEAFITLLNDIFLNSLFNSVWFKSISIQEMVFDILSKFTHIQKILKPNPFKSLPDEFKFKLITRTGMSKMFLCSDMLISIFQKWFPTYNNIHHLLLYSNTTMDEIFLKIFSSFLELIHHLKVSKFPFDPINLFKNIIYLAIRYCKNVTIVESIIKYHKSGIDMNIILTSIASVIQDTDFQNLQNSNNQRSADLVLNWILEISKIENLPNLLYTFLYSLYQDNLANLNLFEYILYHKSLSNYDLLNVVSKLDYQLECDHQQYLNRRSMRSIGLKFYLPEFQKLLKAFILKKQKPLIPLLNPLNDKTSSFLSDPIFTYIINSIYPQSIESIYNFSMVSWRFFKICTNIINQNSRITVSLIKPINIESKFSLIKKFNNLTFSSFKWLGFEERNDIFYNQIESLTVNQNNSDSFLNFHFKKPLSNLKHLKITNCLFPPTISIDIKNIFLENSQRIVNLKSIELTQLTNQFQYQPLLEFFKNIIQLNKDLEVIKINFLYVDLFYVSYFVNAITNYRGSLYISAMYSGENFEEKTYQVLKLANELTITKQIKNSLQFFKSINKNLKVLNINHIQFNDLQYFKNWVTEANSLHTLSFEFTKDGMALVISLINSILGNSSISQVNLNLHLTPVSQNDTKNLNSIFKTLSKIPSIQTIELNIGVDPNYFNSIPLVLNETKFILKGKCVNTYYFILK